jgi:hypothetical protein
VAEVKRIAVLGAGGLGRNMAKLLEKKTEMRLVAICDKGGIAYSNEGIPSSCIDNLPADASVATIPAYGRPASDSIAAVLELRDKIDGIFLALPNLPNDFLPSIVRRLLEGGFSGVLVDALKRTRAVEMVLGLDDLVKTKQTTYITGAGATPGLLTAAAALAAQSFVEVESVEIRFGVGIANWDAYKATIREDIAHLKGFTVEKVAQMTDEEIEQELAKRNGILELENMEHADDIILEVAGIVSRDKVKVGGIVDTRNPKKPVSTTMKLTGITFEGKRSTHTFTLGDETSMAANVNGPALGYMKAGFWYHAHGLYGVFTCADVMPKWPR